MTKYIKIDSEGHIILYSEVGRCVWLSKTRLAWVKWWWAACVLVIDNGMLDGLDISLVLISEREFLH